MFQGHLLSSVGGVSLWSRNFRICDSSLWVFLKEERRIIENVNNTICVHKAAVNFRIWPKKCFAAIGYHLKDIFKSEWIKIVLTANFKNIQKVISIYPYFLFITKAKSNVLQVIDKNKKNVGGSLLLVCKWLKL